MSSRRFLESDEAASTLREMRGSLMGPGSRVHPDVPVSFVIETLLARPESRVVHVVDASGVLLGSVSWRSVLKAAGARMGVRREGFVPFFGMFREITRHRARDLMRKPVTASMDESVRDILLKMETFHENDLAVVDADDQYLGEVNGVRMMQLALRTFEATEAAESTDLR